MDSVYRGGQGGGVGGGGRWGAEGLFFHTFDLKSSHCVTVEVHKQPQFTCQADTVTGSSLTPSLALLVHPCGTIHSKVDCNEFTGSRRTPTVAKSCISHLKSYFKSLKSLIF